MKMLVATSLTQGQRRNDFCFVPEGELVRFAAECDGESVDGKCGCHRSMSGTICLKPTTTVKVIDAPISVECFKDVLIESWKKSGFDRAYKSHSELDAVVNQELDELLRIAASFDVGDILEKRGRAFRQRRMS